ncbi:Uncharacterized alpha/beta hydrolase domain [Salinihabitans flavidus]|uniref:Uncharacterized alpha/beta hydrolase domain n=1 Tax=Salinihabitans flavidus TaxID=569882 RepID=A0A1H8TQ45_9RHOB|nr:DUF2235 domain-containing protein [Salinihabitans flavidus]SEO92734.1 Uncharacterized alpha/beta hydrolase domain [Salinihabitans flavidus]
MSFTGLTKRLFGWLGRPWRLDHSKPGRGRGAQTHVIILDGTMSTLEPGQETNAGQTYRLLQEMGAQVSLYYEAGVQWSDWRTTPAVMMGRGINRQIRRAYGFLASRYRPGDRIFLIGYSRGAFAVRSLAGVIDRVGLLQARHATERNIRQVYRHYESAPQGDAARDFARLYCHHHVEIEMVGVWDTVKALGLRLPLLWQFSEARHEFHNHHLGHSIRHGFHALALHETREVFAPVLWECPPDWAGRAEQVWFRGAHGDVGGQLSGFEAARPLANIPLVWMLERMEQCDLPLPEGWRGRFEIDPQAPSVGTWRGWGKMFLLRKRRGVGRDVSERLHESAQPLPSEDPPAQNLSGSRA